MKLLRRTSCMRVGLDEPKTVLLARVLVASDLLLLEAPVGELDLVREEVASGENMAKAELGPQRLHAMPRLLAALDVRRRLVNLDLEMVVRIALESIEAVRRDLVLVVDLGDGSADVVRVELLVGRDVVEHDSVAVENGSGRRVSLGVGNIGVGGGVEDRPDVVVVAVRVQRDLLLCGRARRVSSWHYRTSSKRGDGETYACCRLGRCEGASADILPGC